MKAKQGLIIKELDNEYILIDSGIESPRFNGMIKLNETSKYIVSLLMNKDMSIEEIYEDMLNTYDTDIETLKKSVPHILDELKKANIIK